MSQLTSPEMDKGQYQEIQAVIEQNSMITGFDLYYLGFLSYHSLQLSLSNIFKHVRNIVNLHNDGLIGNEEKIEFLLRIISKKIDLNLLKGLMPDSRDKDPEVETKRILGDYFSQILKLMPIYGNISKFELFYLGRFHAICPSEKITEIFQHMNNLHSLVSEDLIDEEIQVDFLLKILNKKIKANIGMEKTLRIPQDQDIKLKASPAAIKVKTEEGDNKSNKSKKPEIKTSPTDKQPPQQKDNHSKEKNVSGCTTEANQKRTGDENSAQKGIKSGAGTAEGEKPKITSVSTQRQGNAGTEQKKSDDNAKKSQGAVDKKENVLKEKNLPMDSRKPSENARELDLRNGSGEKKKVVGSKNNFMMKDNRNNQPESGRMEVEEEKKTDEERTSEDSDSSNNASTSISSGDNKGTKRSTGKFLVRATPAETSGSGAVSGLAKRPAIQSNKDSDDEHEFGKNNSKNKREMKKGDGLQELIRRARKSLQTEPVEKMLISEQVTDLMLPPVPSVRESQASVISDKPLIVQWKKRRVLVGLESRQVETQVSYEEESSKEASESPESSYVDEDSMDRIVELGKRANFKDTKDSKKKFKANPSLESEFEEELLVRGNRRGRDFEEEKPIMRTRSSVVIDEKGKLVKEKPIDTGKMIVEKTIVTRSKGVASESLKQQGKVNKDEERQASEKQKAGNVSGGGQGRGQERKDVTRSKK